MSRTKHPLDAELTDEQEAYYEAFATEIENDDTVGTPLPREQWPVNRQGRPSLSAPGQHSPQVTVRLPSATHALALARAREEGKTLSALAREALEAFLAS